MAKAKKREEKADVVRIPNSDEEQRRAALESAMADIEKKCGKGAVMRLGDQGDTKISSIPSGALTLDIALGIGGFPRGRIVEIYGPESSGKTTVALHAVAEAQKLNGYAAFIDAEHALDPEYAARLGVDIDNLIVSQPDNGEQALQIAESLIRSGAVDIVVIDSVAALIPQTELEGAMGETQVGGHARLMSHALRKLTGTIHKSRTAVIFINQIRMKIGVTGYGSPETTTGGNALKFYSSVRLDIRKIQTLKDKEEAYGSLTRVKVVKNKMAPPFREAKFDIIWGTGISRSGELIDLGVDAGIVDKSGAWFAFGAEKLGQGKEKVRALLDETPELRNAIESQLIEHLGMNPRPVVHAPEETLPDPENAPVDDMDDEI